VTSSLLYAAVSKAKLAVNIGSYLQRQLSRTGCSSAGCNKRQLSAGFNSTDSALWRLGWPIFMRLISRSVSAISKAARRSPQAWQTPAAAGRKSRHQRSSASRSCKLAEKRRSLAWRLYGEKRLAQRKK